MRFIFALALLATPALAAPLAPSQIAQIDRIAAQALKETGVPSASIAVVTDGKLQFAKAYGRQRGDASPPTTKAAYPVASMSKQIVAASMLLLAEQGRLSLDDKVSKYLPELTDADQVTLRQLLSHTSGYRDLWPQNYSFPDTLRPTTPQAVLARWGKAPLDFRPGDQWQYSNTGFVAAAQIIDKVSGEPLMTFFRRNIFTPLNMNAGDLDTNLATTDAQPFTRFALGPVRAATPPGRNWFYGAGQLVASPSEWAKWDIARIDHRLLKPDSWREQEREVMLNSGEGSGYGLGVFVDHVRGHARIHHGGAGVGFLSDDRVYPADRAAVIVFVNADFGNAHNAIADGIEAIVLGADPETARARAVFDRLRRGVPDRGALTANFNAFLTPQVIGDYRCSLTPLGEPESFIRTRPTRMRGGFTSEAYEVRYPGRKLTISMRAEPNGGKIEEFLVYPEAE